MAAEPEPAVVERDVIQAVQDALARHETLFVDKVVVIVETSTVDGDRGLWTFTHDGATAWDIMGMLMYAYRLEEEGLRD